MWQPQEVQKVLFAVLWWKSAGVKNTSSIFSGTNAQILAWAELQPWARDMAACQQDAQWHAEGDVWTHTRLVCAELDRLADWPSLDRATQLKQIVTALFH